MPDGGLADLYVALSLQNAQFMSGLEESGSAGEDFTRTLLEGLQSVSDAFGELAGNAERGTESEGAFGEGATTAADACKGLAESATAAGDAVGGATDAISGGAKTATDAVTGLADGAKAATEATEGLTSSTTGLSDGLKGVGDSAAFERDMLAGLAEADKALAEASAAATEALGTEARAMATLRDVSGETAEVADASSVKVLKSEEAAAGGASGLAGHFKLLGIAALAGAAISVKMAGDWQASMTRLVTSAGETRKNIGMVSTGLQQMAIDTATSANQLAAGMYYVESAGFHGADGLEVMRAAAEGAKAENADLTTVADAVTSALNSYGLGAKHATAVTDEMVTAVGRGKMTMQDLASSISTVLPVAAKAHISLAQVTGAIATMTSQGMSAQQASLDLRHAIMSLQNPTSVQSQEMGQLGLNSIDVAKNIGKQGLTGTIQELEEAILKQMGPAGTVLLKSFNQSKLAAQSADEMIKAMPPSLAKLATAYQQGKISAQQWQQIIYKGSESAAAKNLLQQFSTTENAAHGFNEQLKAGGSDAQTFNAALAKMMGGVTGAQVALMVGGAHAKVFSDNVDAIAGSAENAGQNVNNWALIQHNFNFQLGQAGQAVMAMARSFGSALLPAATAVMHVVASFASLIAHNTIACNALAVVVGVLLAGALEKGLVKGLKLGTSGIKDMVSSGGDLIGFFRGADGEASEFSQMLSKIGSVASSAWNGLTGLFTGSADATEAQAAASDAAAAAMEGQAAAADGLAAATDAQEAATDGATAAQTGLDVAMDANPIGLIVLAVAALVAGLVLLATHIDWVIAHWKLLATVGASVLFGPFGTAVMLLIDNFGRVEKAADSLWHDITRIFSGIAADFQPAVSAAENFGHRVASTWDSAVSDARRIWDDFTGWLKQQLSVLTQFWAQHGQEIEEVARVVWSAVSLWAKVNMAIIAAVVKAGWAVVSTVFRVAADLIVTTVKIMMAIIGSAITVGMAAIKATWGVIWAIISNTVETTWSIIGETIHQALQLITGIIGIALDLITGHWSQAWHDLVTLASQQFHDVVSVIKTIASGFGNLLWSAGEALIHGLIGGMKAMVGAAISAVKSVGSSIVHGAESILGIHSPSRVFYQHGQMIVAGLIAGMDDGHGAVTAAAARLAAATQSPMLASRQIAALAVGGDGAYAAPLAAAAGGGVVLNVNVHVQYGFVGTEQQLADALFPIIQRATLDHGLYNGTTGLQLAGR